jgi:hypothetical protein
MPRKGAIRLLLPLLLLAGPAAAQDADTAALIKALTDRVEALEGQVAALQAALTEASAAPPAAAAPAPPPVSPVVPGATSVAAVNAADPTAAQRLMNPAIGVIGNLLGSAGDNAIAPSPSLEMAESEVSFSAAVDPYARADVFLSFGETGVDVEEAYATFPAIPGGLLLKAGKQRAPFGKANLMHRHVLPWVDRPLVIDHLLGGEEGLSDAGATVSRLLPSPGNIFLEASGSVFRGDSEGIFAAQQRSDVSTVAHLRGYGDLNEESNLDLGFSFARGHNDSGLSYVSRLYGVDGTFRWKPLRRAIYHSFIGRTEILWSSRFEPDGPHKAFGYYASGDYQAARRWFLGARFDQSERLDGQEKDSGASAVVTFWPSEFSQLRAQYRLTHYAEHVNANELLLQLQFALGAHGAHPF